ncbi:MAG: 2-oxoglutarate oxidoreductase [Candidatus Omnitrophica bacterium]|nr:2-oxoglutarate oxidoreductase [Candidatus Omnitrophota bacterium]
MKEIYKPPKLLKNKETHYCPGCGHGIVHRLVAQAVEELNLAKKVIGVAPVGCAVLAYDYWNFDVSEAAHGRALAVATGMKRCLPDHFVFTYQGDGDLASIGLTETVHAANRGENLTCIFINNACYGMTGGQMAPTTLLEQKTATTPKGRNSEKKEGWPLQISNILAGLKGVSFVARSSISNPTRIKQSYKYIKQAFINQIDKKGFSLVELLSPCPTIWQMTPYQAGKWIEEKMSKTFPLGIIKK